MANLEHLAILKQGVEVWNAWREKNPGLIKPDLKGANLEGADLYGADLKGVEFGEACYQTDIQDSSLWGPLSFWTNCQGVNFKGANLGGARLEGAVLPGANFEGAILIDAKLTGADLRGVNLNKAILEKARFEGANLHRARLKQANLGGAILKRTNLSWTDLSGAILYGVEFDDKMICRCANVTNCIGSQRFVKHVKDLDYIEETKEKHPVKYWSWKLLTDCGRSWLKLLGWCVAVLYVFWAIFDLLHVHDSLVTSIMAFTSFGFVDSKAHNSTELTLICIEAMLGYVMFGALVSLIASQIGRRSE